MDTPQPTPTSTQPAIPEQAQAAKPKRNGKGKGKAQDDKIPGRWGMNEAKFYFDRENELVAVHMRSGETITGYVIGLDVYAIMIERESDQAPILMHKHAIDWIEPATAATPKA